MTGRSWHESEYVEPAGSSSFNVINDGTQFRQFGFKAAG